MIMGLRTCLRFQPGFGVWPPGPHPLEQPTAGQLRPGPERRVISPEQTEAALYVMKMYGYQGYFGIDINPERMPVQQALKNNMDALRQPTTASTT